MDNPACLNFRAADLLAVVLVLAGLGYALATRDKLGLVVAFAGVILAIYGVLKPEARSPDGEEPPTF